VSEIEQEYLCVSALGIKGRERVPHNIICSQYTGHVEPAHTRLSGQ